MLYIQKCVLSILVGLHWEKMYLMECSLSVARHGWGVVGVGIELMLVIGQFRNNESMRCRWQNDLYIFKCAEGSHANYCKMMPWAHANYPSHVLRESVFLLKWCVSGLLSHMLTTPKKFLHKKMLTTLLLNFGTRNWGFLEKVTSHPPPLDAMYSRENSSNTTRYQLYIYILFEYI